MRLSTRRLLLTDEDRKAEITVPELLEAGVPVRPPSETGAAGEGAEA